MRLPLLAGTAFLGLLLTGCPSAAPPSAFPNADAALGRMKATLACVNGVQGNAKIDHFSPRGRIRGDLYLLTANADRVRFDVVSPFGATLYTLTSDGKRFQMLNLGEKEFLQGPASPCNLARLTQVPIPGHALVSLLRGEAPVLLHQPDAASISWDPGGFYKLAIQSSREATQEIHLEVHPDDVKKPWEQQRARATYVRVAQRGVDLYEADLRNWKGVKNAGPKQDPDGLDPDVQPIGLACDAELPESIRMKVPNTEEDVVFQYKDAKWNPGIEASAFTQPVPGGVRTMAVDCGK